MCPRSRWPVWRSPTVTRERAVSSTRGGRPGVCLIAILTPGSTARSEHAAADAVGGHQPGIGADRCHSAARVGRSQVAAGSGHDYGYVSLHSGLFKQRVCKCPLLVLRHQAERFSASKVRSCRWRFWTATAPWFRIRTRRGAARDAPVPAAEVAQVGFRSVFVFELYEFFLFKWRSIIFANTLGKWNKKNIHILG